MSKSPSFRRQVSSASSQSLSRPARLDTGNPTLAFWVRPWTDFGSTGQTRSRSATAWNEMWSERTPRDSVRLVKSTAHLDARNRNSRLRDQLARRAAWPLFLDSLHGSWRDDPRKEDDAASSRRGGPRDVQPLDGRTARAPRASRVARAGDARDVEGAVQGDREGQAKRALVDRRGGETRRLRGRPCLVDGQRLRSESLPHRPGRVAQ